MKMQLGWKFRLAAIGAGGLAFALFQGMSAVPSITETVYGNVVGPLLASVLSNLSAILPMSLAELFIAAFIGRQLWSLFVGVRDIRSGERGMFKAGAAGLFRLGADIGIVVALFYVLWGFNYARPPLEQRQAWDGNEADVEELARLSVEMIEAANFEYVNLTRTDDSGTPTEAPPHEELVAQLDEGWDEAQTIFGAPAAALFGYGAPKPLWASWALDYTLTSGFYFPWTGEANFNRRTPAVSLPQVVAHEMAHQRGFAPEDEANFAGYVAAALSSDSYPRYSAYVFAQRQLLSALARTDRERAALLVALRLPGVQRDIEAANEYWAQFEGPTSRVSRSMNNAYLRTNRVPDGILSYGRSVELLIAYARSRGGWLVRS